MSTSVPAPRRVPASQLRLGGLAALLLIASLILVEVGDATWSFEGPPLWWVLLFLSFAAAEAQQFHVEIRRQTFSMSLSEIPLILGILTLGLAATVILRLTAMVIVIVVRRTSPVKASLNLCLVALECVVFAELYAMLGAAETDITRPMLWLGILGTVFTVNAISFAAVLAAVTWTQGFPNRRFLLDLAIPIVITSVVNTLVALVVAIVLSASAWGAVMMAILGGLLALGFRAYANSLHQQRTLGQVYDFAKGIEATPAETLGEQQTVDAVREMLNSERAALWLEPTEQLPGRIVFARAESALGVPRDGSYDGPATAHDALREQALRSGTGRLFNARSAVAAEREAVLLRRAREVVGVPLSTAAGVVGYLEVCDRRGDRLNFSAEDVALMDSLATHVSASAHNSQLMQELRHEATHDRLTGLPNRVAVGNAVTELLARSAEHRGFAVGVVVIDLQTLAEVNDTLGHEAGDALLVAIAQRLTCLAPADAVVGRMGGEEFAVVGPVAGAAEAEVWAEQLRGQVSRPCEVSGLSVEVNAAIGLVVGPDHGHTSAVLLQRADVALYSGQASESAVSVYQPSMGESSLRRLYLGTQLREAMAGGEIYVEFQPQVHLASSTVGAVETLVRWHHPRFGVVSPDDFIPVAERIGMMTLLTVHVLTLALQQCRKWLDRGMRISVAVNLSARSLGDPELQHHVRRILLETGVPPQLLCLEITESSVMGNPAVALPALSAFHRDGIRLSVDDFGTGHSSLAYLARLPVDEVKIDKSFVQNLGTETAFMSVTRTIIDLAHGLGMAVVAEGVEDELTRDLLAGMGCDTIQGYLVSRPLASDRLDRWLRVRAGQPKDEAHGGAVVVHLFHSDTG